MCFSHPGKTYLATYNLSNAPEGIVPYSFVFQDVEASTAASKRLRNRGAREQEAEAAAQAAALEDVPEGDVFASWAKAEDGATLKQWQPLR